MSETHTPGPWTWWTSNSWRRLARDDRRGGQFAWVLEPIKQNDGHPDCLVSEADMGLIAAAPDLLEALKEMRLAFSHGYEDDVVAYWKAHAAEIAKSQTESGYRTEFQIKAGVIERARAAIAKAETPVSR